MNYFNYASVSRGAGSAGRGRATPQSVPGRRARLLEREVRVRESVKERSDVSKDSEQERRGVRVGRTLLQHDQVQFVLI